MNTGKHCERQYETSVGVKKLRVITLTSLFGSNSGSVTN